MGISLDHIKQKFISILTFNEIEEREVIKDTDLLGPLCILLFYCFNLYLQLKLHMGYIYLLLILGGLFIYMNIKLISEVIFL
jgi:hypothetical protein